MVWFCPLSSNTNEDLTPVGGSGFSVCLSHSDELRFSPAHSDTDFVESYLLSFTQLVGAMAGHSSHTESRNSRLGVPESEPAQQWQKDTSDAKDFPGQICVILVINGQRLVSSSIITNRGNQQQVRLGFCSRLLQELDAAKQSGTTPLKFLQSEA